MIRYRVAAKTTVVSIFATAAILSALAISASAAPSKHLKKTPEQLRQEYLAKVAATWTEAAPRPTTGSLWSPDGVLNDGSRDYKAHALHDVLTVAVSVQTTAAQSGSVDNSRAFATNSAITALPGGLSTTGTNPLLAANSSSSLKGQGQTGSSTTFNTSLTGEVIAVLPNGNLVVEAHQQIDMNHQHEEVIVRGIARPGDIAPNNVIASTSLGQLEVELKGKGIISDNTRPPNAIARAVMWLFNF